MSTGAQIVRGEIVTMDPRRRVFTDGAVVLEAERIAAVGRFEEVRAQWPAVAVAGSPSDLVTPGYLNGHQHLTGDRLIQSTIPDGLPPGAAIFQWAVPVHAEHEPDDDELSATLTLATALRHGITSVWEAGTVAHPDRVAAAANAVGARLTVGTWGWDVDEGPYAAPVDEVIDRQRQTLALEAGPLVSSWVALVGHDLMSDDLVVAASELARSHDARLTFHLSPTTSDPESYLKRTGRRPVVHLHDLGVLGDHVAIGHGVHLDDDELTLLVDSSTSVVSCPWAYLRLGQGITREFRHLAFWERGGRLALGCDAENAGDVVDAIRTAALFAGLAKDVPVDPQLFGAHEALELLTVKGAEALGVSDQVGSIEVGKQADLVVHDRTQLHWVPAAPDPVLQLIWASDGRSVRDVWVAGRRVVEGGVVLGIDLDALRSEAAVAGRRLMARAGLSPTPRWPPI